MVRLLITALLCAGLFLSCACKGKEGPAKEENFKTKEYKATEADEEYSSDKEDGKMKE
jgi:hypothetical protein